MKEIDTQFKINKIENNREKLVKNKSCLFEKANKSDNYLASLTKKKREKIQMTRN